MAFKSRTTRFWLMTSVASLLAYDLYWLIDSFAGQGYYIGFGMVINAFKQLLGISTGLSTIWIAGHAFAAIGIIIRFVELVLALSLVFLVWGRGRSFFGLKQKLSVAILLEGVYFLCLSFSVVMLHQIGQDILAISYFLQIALISPLMIVLSIKVWKSQDSFSSSSILKWVAVAFVGYTAAIGVNNVSRWVVFAKYFNNQVIPSGSAIVGFANSIICLVVALVFAVTGSVLLFKRKNQDLVLKVYALSLVALGAHFVLYLVYSYFLGSLGLVMLVEIWAIPLLGLGASLFRETTQQKKREIVVESPSVHYLKSSESTTIIG